ncbi:MAG: hypothetical protein BWZ01_00701 [Deltaproteobacteria bacterium ADurb.BinA179]|nr:MAG: hypothetical protein BWZ01_00701 [Deltaproteobacteria bacterium ADurb.BinA179]
MRDGRYVQAAGRDVRGHEDAVRAAAEAFDGVAASVLGQITLERHGLQPKVRELARQALGAVPGARENEHRACLRAAQQLFQERGLQVMLHRIQGVGYRVHGFHAADLHGGGIVCHLVRKAAQLVGHGGGEEHGLPLCGQKLDDAADVRQKAHVEQAVGLVEDEMLHTREIDAPAGDVVEQPARACRNDLDPAFEGRCLGHDVYAAEHGHALQARASTQCLEGLVDL